MFKFTRVVGLSLDVEPNGEGFRLVNTETGETRTFAAARPALTCDTCVWAGVDQRTYRDCLHPTFQSIGSDTPIVPIKYGCILHEKER